MYRGIAKTVRIKSFRLIARVCPIHLELSFNKRANARHIFHIVSNYSKAHYIGYLNQRFGVLLAFTIDLFCETCSFFCTCLDLNNFNMRIFKEIHNQSP